jgi:hypothetical protein
METLSEAFDRLTDWVSAPFRLGMTRSLAARNERSACRPRHPSRSKAAHADQPRKILTRSSVRAAMLDDGGGNPAVVFQARLAHQ